MQSIQPRVPGGPGPVGGPGWRGRSVVLVLAGQVALGIVVAALALLLAGELRERAIGSAEVRLRSQAQVLADHAERAFEAVDVVIAGTLDRLRVKEIGTPDGFARAMEGEAVRAELVARAGLLPQLGSIAVIGADGLAINNSQTGPMARVDVSDRDYFVRLRGEADVVSMVSAPVRSRATGAWTAYVARKVVTADGRFAGVVLGAVNLAYFEELYSRITAGPGFWVSLFRRDGMLMARYPHVEADIGRSFGSGALLGRFADPGVHSAEAHQPGRISGTELMIAGHDLSNQPLVVTVAFPLDAALAEWRSLAVWLAVSAAVLEAVLVAVGVLTLRQMRGQRVLAEARAARLEAESALAVARERARADLALGRQNLRFAAALGNMSQALCMFDADDRLIVANPRMAELFAVGTDGIAPGTALEALLAPRPEGRLSGADMAQMRGTAERLKRERAPISEVLEVADGRTLAANFAPVPDVGWLVTLEDISDRRQAEARISHMAMHDALTGLPNRVRFHERLTEAVARARRGHGCAVMFLDLDRFKAVNDTLGHPVGDSLLRAVTARLRAEVRATDTVARLGGDEFAIVQASGEQPGDSTALAERLIAVVGAPYELDGHQVVIGTSVGIALEPADGDDPDQVLRCADLALYRAKEDGRGGFRYFEPGMDARMRLRRALESDLRNALTTGAFEVFYQPLMHVRSRAVSGFEALLRWNHPERGLVPPSEFMALAEEIGLIVPLGEWVLRQACMDAALWPGSPKVAVNISPAQFASRGLVADVAGALEGSGLDPRRLELEITETVLLGDPEGVLAVLRRLKALGVGIALDDFGTGYSVLSYLRRFPFSNVKIDRSFIDSLGSGGDGDAIVRAVLELCESLRIATTAEGVETEEQLLRLLAGRCTNAQGFLFSEAKRAEEIAELCARLRAEQRLVAA